VTFTITGGAPRLVSSYRPPVPIIAVCDDPRVWRQLALVWAVHPVLFEGETVYDAMLERARTYILDNCIGFPGQRIVVTAGVPFHVSGTTNMLRVEEL
jgi:pyruvate kinase